MKALYLESLSEDEKRQLAEVLETLRRAVDTVDGFDYMPPGTIEDRVVTDGVKFVALANLPVVLAKVGASLAKVTTRLAAARQARLAELKTRLDAVRVAARLAELKTRLDAVRVAARRSEQGPCGYSVTKTS